MHKKLLRTFSRQGFAALELLIVLVLLVGVVVTTFLAQKRQKPQKIAQTTRLLPQAVTAPITESYRRGFVTSTTFNGNLGGITGANNSCTTLAANAGLTGVYHALLSDQNTDAKDNILPDTDPSLPYKMVNGTIIANNYIDLMDRSIQNPMLLDEKGNDHSQDFIIDGTNMVYTGSNDYGVKTNYHCSGWTSSNPTAPDQATIGNLIAKDYGWISQSAGYFCGDNQRRLYCFQKDITTALVTPTPSPDPSLPPTCSIGLNPTTLQLGIGDTAIISANVVLSGSSTILNSVQFTDLQGSGGVDLNPAIATAIPYQTNATGKAYNSTGIDITAYAAVRDAAGTAGGCTSSNQVKIYVYDPSVTTPTPIAGWYSAVGGKCDRTQYQTFYSDQNCGSSSIIGYITEGIGSLSCAGDGSGSCFKVGGNFISSSANSYNISGAPNCYKITTAAPVSVYTQLHQCSFGPPPPAIINGSVTVNFSDPSQFDQLHVWLQDITGGTTEPSDFPLNRADIISGLPNLYSFNNLDMLRAYDIYAKVYNQTVYLDTPTYESSCGNTTCRENPPAQVDFTITFPELRDANGNIVFQLKNIDFERAIEKWQQGSISALEMSQFIKYITRVPGLQKETCDPKVPGGCIPPS